ncbi:MAG: chorismate mutase, partial [Cyanobacteria bacterium]|nr:chorismate mutase [Cyanobacteriota bacterium]
EESVSDARQAISLQDMIDIVESIRPIAKAVGRTVGDEPVVSTESTLSRLKSTIGVLEESRRNERDIISVCENRISGPVETLRELRREIDLVDLEIAALLEQRLNLALQIGGLKQKHNIPWRDLHRERDVLNSVTATSVDRKTSAHIRQIYERLIELTTAAQSDQSSTSQVA